MTIEQAAREYIRLRRLRIDLKEHRNELHRECDADYDGGGRGCCVFQSREEEECMCDDIVEKSEWCPLCLESDVAHEWFVLASRAQGVALRRLEREVNRNSATKG